MANLNRTLVRESLDLETYQKDRMVFVGKLTDYNQETKTYKFAFKFEKVIMRLEMTFKNDKCKIVQIYPDSVTEFTLKMNSKEDYCLILNNSYKLFFVTEASLIKYDEKEIKLKYNLYDKNTNQAISINEISIIGENDIC